MRSHAASVVAVGADPSPRLRCDGSFSQALHGREMTREGQAFFPEREGSATVSFLRSPPPLPSQSLVTRVRSMVCARRPEGAPRAEPPAPREPPHANAVRPAACWGAPMRPGRAGPLSHTARVGRSAVSAAAAEPVLLIVLRLPGGAGRGESRVAARAPGRPARPAAGSAGDAVGPAGPRRCGAAPLHPVFPSPARLLCGRLGVLVPALRTKSICRDLTAFSVLPDFCF